MMTSNSHRRGGVRGIQCAKLCLAGLAGATLLLAAWLLLTASGPLAGTAALAADPDSGVFNAGNQRVAITQAIDVTNAKIEQTNAKLDKLITLLESGKLRVVAVSEEKAGDESKK